MPVALGTEVYNADATPVRARGFSYAQSELDEARNGRIPEILSDQSGLDSLAELYGSLELTEFGTEGVVRALQPLAQEDHSRGWREGEALGEAWLVDHHQCEFPWPFNRDLRHHRASLPGAELVGFTGTTVATWQFACGQVKTSKESQNPPQVVNRGDKCLINQALQLRDNTTIKNTLVNYLAQRVAIGAPWTEKFKAVATRYFNSGQMDIAIFGVLVRDVEPARADLAGAATRLSDGCHASTRIELYGLYVPSGCIPAGPQHAPRPRRTTP